MNQSCAAGREKSFFDSIDPIRTFAFAGHEVELLPEPYSDLVGHAGAIVLNPDGTLEARTIRGAAVGAAGL